MSKLLIKCFILTICFSIGVWCDSEPPPASSDSKMADTDPAADPAAENPPADNPPAKTAESPPVDKPPAENPPADNPPAKVAESPPADKPPAENPAAANPPSKTAESSQADKPPAEGPPSDNPPGKSPSVDKTPAESPPSDKPAGSSPVDKAPAESPPANNPPAAKSSVDEETTTEENEYLGPTAPPRPEEPEQDSHAAARNPILRKASVPLTPDSDLSDVEFLQNYDEIIQQFICHYSKLSDPQKFSLRITRPATLQDVTKLTFLVKGKGLRTEKLPFPADINWRRGIVDSLFDIFMAKCPDEYVNHEYLNVMRELSLIYLNSLSIRSSPYSSVWSYIQKTLTNCKASEEDEANNFTSQGLLIDSLLYFPQPIGLHPNETIKLLNDATTEPGEVVIANRIAEVRDPELIKINVQVEKAERAYILNPIIDTLWMVFSHAWATCLDNIDSESSNLWGLKFKQLFYQDFLRPLEYPWKLAGSLPPNLHLITGDFDIKRMEHNLRHCYQAAYTRVELSQSQLIRPISIGGVERRVSYFQNRRILI